MEQNTKLRRVKIKNNKKRNELCTRAEIPKNLLNNSLCDQCININVLCDVDSFYLKNNIAQKSFSSNTTQHSIEEINYFKCIPTSEENLSLERNLPENILQLIKIKPAKDKPEFTDSVQDKCISIINNVTMGAVVASEFDINLLLETVETMYYSLRNLFHKMKQQTMRMKRQKENYAIKINLSNFLGYLNTQYKNNSMINNTPLSSNQELVLCNKENCMASSPHGSCKSFEITIDRRCMSYHISKCKFNSLSMDFFKTLASMYNCGKLTFDANKSNRAISVLRRDWHVTNVTQGYLLTILLKNCNVASLNVMRKLYFVIITSETPNLTIELNFKLANCIFMAYNTKFADNCPFELTQWSDTHKSILDKTTKLNGSPLNRHGIRGNIVQFTNIVPTICKSNSSYYYDSQSTLINGSSIRSDDSDVSIFYSESESYFMTSEGSADSVDTSTLSIDNDVSRLQCAFYVRKACGNTNFQYMAQEHYNLFGTTMQQSKIWFSSLIESMKTNLGVPNLNYEHVINETVFGWIILDEYLEALSQYCVQLKSQQFCELFVERLGLAIIHTLFSSVIN